MTQAKAPYFIVQAQVELMNGQFGHTTYLKDSPEEGVAEEMADAASIEDRENGIARIGILAGYMGRKDAKSLVESIVGPMETTLTTVNLNLIHMDKNGHIHHPCVARAVLFVTKSDDGDYTVKIAGRFSTPINKEDE